ncbi:hypothetical protein NSU_2419 [Novosphingobium pentaromativorans US6-1]|uniref:Uncharacterized protein n=1 Tax=Novosphingobium pentaromativorans US6-1 TaxID=1088721 RepID=G6EDJ7_9SPHN|nr:hypothetical protein NSU_2419 [Novosphingobium pentaromativorans US6-1]
MDTANHKLLAAAEPFENLTESSFSAGSDELSQLIATARSSAKHVMSQLPPAAAQDLQVRLDEIGKAQNADKRADVALAAVEGYRTLVSNVQGRTIVPQQVSLLDYAGFRIQADLKASPARWTDIASALGFAKQRWGEISDQVHTKKVAADMQTALSDMTSAVSSQDSKMLQQASTRELDLVDELENYFTKSAAS